MRKNKKIYILIFFMIISSITLTAQIGGNHIYSFSNLPMSSRISAMGGLPIAINDKDNSIAILNPAMNTKENNHMLTMSFIDYFGDVTAGNAIFSKSFNSIGNFNLGIQYINYGQFTETDETEQYLGEFSANENALIIGWGRKISEQINIGANLKTLVSNFYRNNSWGVASDISASYLSKNKNFSATVLARNLGRQIKTYNGIKEPIAYEIMVGISQKMEHTPFAYTLTYSHLEKFDLTYNKLETEKNESILVINDTKNTESKVEKFANKFMRHIIIGAEFTPSKNIGFRFGYNYRRRQELKIETKKSLVGFSGGVEIKISKFRFGYSRASYHIAGALNQFTISTNISDFTQKKHDILSE